MNDLVKNEPNEIANEIYTGKVIRDGKVAVLYSPGFGAGWSTWDSDYGEELIFDPMMVKYVEEDNYDALYAYAAMRYPSAYTGGLGDLTIAWLPEGTLFRIEEYDGSESIETLGDTDWIKA
jgi:hypothetical protein